MRKPNGFDEVQANNEWVPFSAGGHEMVIKHVEERSSKSGQPMIVVSMDTAPSDCQPSYFSNAFNDDIRPDKKWPFQGTKYIMVNEYDFNARGFSNKCSKDYKAFCVAFEASNGCDIDWESKDWGAQFAGKKIGAVYGNVESEYNGKVTKRAELRWWCEFSKAKISKVPNEKLLAKTAAAAYSDPSPFSGKEISDADVPWS